jgi:hypothetical protein
VVADHSHCLFPFADGDDLSVAGTDFNEPWDSNAWENLLELAKFGDAKTEGRLLDWGEIATAMANFSAFAERAASEATKLLFQ